MVAVLGFRNRQNSINVQIYKIWKKSSYPSVWFKEWYCT